MPRTQSGSVQVSWTLLWACLYSFTLHGLVCQSDISQILSKSKSARTEIAWNIPERRVDHFPGPKITPDILTPDPKRASVRDVWKFLKFAHTHTHHRMIAMGHKTCIEGTYLQGSLFWLKVKERVLEWRSITNNTCSCWERGHGSSGR